MEETSFHFYIFPLTFLYVWGITYCPYLIMRACWLKCFNEGSFQSWTLILLILQKSKLKVFRAEDLKFHHSDYDCFVGFILNPILWCVPPPPPIPWLFLVMNEKVKNIQSIARTRGRGIKFTCFDSQILNVTNQNWTVFSRYLCWMKLSYVSWKNPTQTFITSLSPSQKVTNITPKWDS